MINTTTDQFKPLATSPAPRPNGVTAQPPPLLLFPRDSRATMANYTGQKYNF